MAAITAQTIKVPGVVALTESGYTALWMSRAMTNLPIFGLSRSLTSMRKMTLYRGVHPLWFNFDTDDPEEIEQLVQQYLLDENSFNAAIRW